MTPQPTRDYCRASVVSPARAPVLLHFHALTPMHGAASALCLGCPWDLDIETLSATHRVPQNTYFFLVWVRG